MNFLVLPLGSLSIYILMKEVSVQVYQTPPATCLASNSVEPFSCQYMFPVPFSIPSHGSLPVVHGVRFGRFGYAHYGVITPLQAL